MTPDAAQGSDDSGVLGPPASHGQAACCHSPAAEKSDLLGEQQHSFSGLSDSPGHPTACSLPAGDRRTPFFRRFSLLPALGAFITPGFRSYLYPGRSALFEPCPGFLKVIPRFLPAGASVVDVLDAASVWREPLRLPWASPGRLRLDPEVSSRKLSAIGRSGPPRQRVKWSLGSRCDSEVVLPATGNRYLAAREPGPVDGPAPVPGGSPPECGRAFEGRPVLYSEH